MDTSGLSIGTRTGGYREGEQLVVAHWLGDESTPDGIKRLYYFDRDASYVQDEIGRLLFLVNRGDDPKFIDIKENRTYDWVLAPPGVNPDNENAFDMEITGDISSPYVTPPRNIMPPRPNFDAEENNTEIGRIGVTGYPNPAVTGSFIEVYASTDITQASVTVTTQGETVVREIYYGALEQGLHVFFLGWTQRCR